MTGCVGRFVQLDTSWARHAVVGFSASLPGRGGPRTWFCELHKRSCRDCKLVLWPPRALTVSSLSSFCPAQSHESFFDFEPLSGSAMHIVGRSQLSVYVQPLDGEWLSQCLHPLMSRSSVRGCRYAQHDHWLQQRNLVSQSQAGPYAHHVD